MSFEISGKVTIESAVLRPLTDTGNNMNNVDLILEINISSLIDGIKLSDYKIRNTHLLSKDDFEKIKSIIK